MSGDRDRISKILEGPPVPEEGDIELGIYLMEHCNPKRCSARKLVRLGLAEGYSRLDEVPRGGVLLSPFSKKSISREDLPRLEKSPLIVLDCSWARVEGSFPLMKRKRLRERALPYLIPVNPINYGHPFKLSTLEALAAALAILGNWDQSLRLLEIYNWGPHFLVLNKRFLEAYAEADTSKEVVESQMRFVKEAEG